MGGGKSEPRDNSHKGVDKIATEQKGFYAPYTAHLALTLATTLLLGDRSLQRL